MRYVVTKGVRYFELFAVGFLVWRVVLGFIADGWSGIDLAAAWMALGPYLPAWFAGWFITWGVLTAADSAQRRSLRAESVEGDV